MSGGCNATRSGRAGERTLLSTLARLVRYADGRMRKRQSRRALLDLTEEQLRDIGVSRFDAVREGYRPFWD